MKRVLGHRRVNDFLETWTRLGVEWGQRSHIPLAAHSF